MTLDYIKRVAVPACREFNVRRLDAFGSTARGDDSEASDIDLLVEFKEPETHLSRRFFGLLHSLEDALGRDIDLVTLRGLRNPYFRDRVLKEKVPIYEG